MGDRHFPTRPASVAGRGYAALYITCGEDGCSVTADFINTGRSKSNPDYAIKDWRRQGWYIGSNDHRDRCPVHNKKAPGRREQPEESAVQKVVPINHSSVEKSFQGQLTQAAIIAAKEVREPDREDKRIIFDKLTDVYVDVLTGYRDDWTDDKVAADLNCPRAWVEAIRDEFFGPAIGAHHTNDLEDRYRQLEAELKEIVTKIPDIMLGMDALRADIQKLKAR